MRALRDDDARWHDGRVFSLVFHPGDETAAFVREAYNLWLVGGVAVTLLLLLLAVIRTDLGYRLMRLAGGANNTRPPEQMV